MSDIGDLMKKRHGVNRVGFAYFGDSVCCWVNRSAPTMLIGMPDYPIDNKETIHFGKSGWRVGWAPTLPEAFMIALMSQCLEPPAIGKE